MGGTVLPGPDPEGADAVVSWPARAADGYRAAVEARLGPAGSEPDFARKAQFVEYEVMRALCEAWRAQRQEWPGGGPVGDLPGTGGPYRLDGGYYGARKGCEPLHAQVDQRDGKVLVVNGTPAAVRGLTVTAQAYDLGGRPLREPVAARVDVAAGDGAEVGAVPFDRGLPATHLLRLRVTDAEGRVRSVNDYWRYRTPTDMRSLNGLPGVRLSLAAHPADRPAEGRTADGRTAVTATVRNTGTSPAAMVRLMLLDADGTRLRAAADDNYLWLLPGESREVTVTCPAPGPDGRRPIVAAEAYNAGPTRAAHHGAATAGTGTTAAG
ncbi:FxLYD domain-containing protein [Streptomyces sp. HPF1205]|uniref:FxLYD domain-containing protein n=1 Tax=Streptomyces sp. HPF1205 TaxID=2873262 RepID=UPI001CEDDF62|nr:FxLYD domain-containing protein [Streptomyces sp. HPF1205]